MCTGTISWAFPSSRRRTFPVRISAILVVTTQSKRHSGCSSPRRVAPSISPGSPPTSSLSNAKPDRSPRLPGSTLGPNSNGIPATHGYRLERGGKAIVYTTDSEHKLEDPAETQAFVYFFRNADLVIIDAMYSLLEAVSVKEGWGHSSNIVGVERSQLANVKHLCMFHHEPAFNDERIQSVLNETIRFERLTRGKPALIVSAAFDGMEIEV